MIFRWNRRSLLFVNYYYYYFLFGVKIPPFFTNNALWSPLETLYGPSSTMHQHCRVFSALPFRWNRRFSHSKYLQIYRPNNARRCGWDLLTYILIYIIKVPSICVFMFLTGGISSHPPHVSPATLPWKTYSVVSPYLRIKIAVNSASSHLLSDL